MAFVPGFKHDVFVSYAHANNVDPFAPTDPGWVDRLHVALETILKERLNKREFSLWRDLKLQGNDMYDRKIARAVDASAVFIAITSPAYVDSAYCIQELDQFVGKATDSKYGLTVDDTARLFRVGYGPLRADQTTPASFAGMDGYSFHDAEEKRLNGDALVDPVFQLAGDIADLLQAMKAGTLPNVQEPQGPTVYLAAATPDLASDRAKLKAHFQQYDVRVLPDELHETTDHEDDPDDPRGGYKGPTAANMSDLKDELSAALARATLTVHLVGGEYGGWLYGNGLNPSLPEYEYDVAVELADTDGLGSAVPREDGEDPLPPRPVIVWTPHAIVQKAREQAAAAAPDGNGVDKAQIGFLRRVVRGPSSRVERVEQGKADLIATCFNSLGIEIAPETETEEVKPHNVLVSFCAEAREHPQFQPVLACLNSNGIQPDQDQAADEPLPSHAAMYDGCLVLYLECPEAWARARATQVRGIQLQQKGLAGGVYDGPPPAHKDELQFQSPTVPILKAEFDFDCGVLDPFVSRVSAT